MAAGSFDAVFCARPGCRYQAAGSSGFVLRAIAEHIEYDHTTFVLTEKGRRLAARTTK